jgi:hypothetical protein
MTMTSVVKTELAQDLADYDALLELCAGASGDHVLGAALDVAAGVIATRLAGMAHEAGLNEHLLPAIAEVNFRYGRGRDSIAIAPILALVQADAPLVDITQAMVDGLGVQHPTDDSQPQTVEQAWADLKRLIAVTGTGGKWGEVMFMAREAGQYAVDSIRYDWADENGETGFQFTDWDRWAEGYQPTERDIATDA